jgi:hypothetical protein
LLAWSRDAAGSQNQEKKKDDADGRLHGAGEKGQRVSHLSVFHPKSRVDIMEAIIPAAYEVKH